MKYFIVFVIGIFIGIVSGIYIPYTMFDLNNNIKSILLVLAISLHFIFYFFILKGETDE